MIHFSRIMVLAALICAGVVQAAEFGNGARAKLIEEYAQKLEDTYVFPAKGKLLADGLRSHLKHGDYAGLEEKALAEQVQKDLDAIVPDQHNGLVYVEFDALEEPPPPPHKPAVPVARPGPDNFGLAKFEMKGKVAYLQVSRFGPVDSFATEALAKVMSQAADS